MNLILVNIGIFVMFGILLGLTAYLAGGKKSLWSFIGLNLIQMVLPYSIKLSAPIPVHILGKAAIMTPGISVTAIAILAILIFGKKEHRYGTGLFILHSLICAILALIMFF